MARPHTVPPQSQAFIPLSEALTWADRRIALSAQQMVDEASFDQYEAEKTNRRRREVLHRLLDLALDGQLRMQGRPFNDDEDEVLTVSIGAQKGPPIGVQKGPLCGAA